MKWWRRLFRRGTADREFQDEIETHIAEATDYYVSQGMPPDAARRLARLRFGNPRAHREQVNDMHRLPLFDVLGRDLRIAVRRLRQAPGFSAAVILTLALVVGATSAVFSVSNRVCCQKDARRNCINRWRCLAARLRLRWVLGGST